VLLNQFNAEFAVHWQAAYGVFCSQHTQAVNLYKDLLKTDRRFQEFVQHSSQNPLLRKMGIPECILTISTRITKYPLLIEPLIKTAKDRPEERQKLEICHQLVKSILIDVNGQVAEKERGQRLMEIYSKLDAKSYIQVDARKFKKSDFLMENRKLLFEGVCTLTHPQVTGNVPVNVRGNRSPAPTPVNIVVLSDVLVFLQESSQTHHLIQQY
jgi:A-kinase anchor protein 13